jgi:hypothetical protein
MLVTCIPAAERQRFEPSPLPIGCNNFRTGFSMPLLPPPAGWVRFDALFLGKEMFASVETIFSSRIQPELRARTNFRLDQRKIVPTKLTTNDNC